MANGEEVLREKNTDTKPLSKKITGAKTERNRTKTYAVSLLFDAAFSASVSALADDFARVTQNDALVKKDAPVHLTLGMFHVSDPCIPQLVSLFLQFARPLQDMPPLEFCGIGSFKEKVIFLAADKSSGSLAYLKELNARLHELFLPHFEAGANRNYLPGCFFPHIALAVKLKSSQFKKAAELRLSNQVPTRPPKECALKANVASLSLARCRPYGELVRN